MRRYNIILLAAVLVLILIPLFIVNEQEDSEIFTGADGQAEDAIVAMHADYEPWFTPLWEPPSGEIESFLFGLQSALGSGLVFYCLGIYRGRKQARIEAGKS